MGLIGPHGLIASDVRWATTPRSRSKGLRGWQEIEPGQALILRPCRQVHTFWLGFGIDAVFCDGEMNVLHISSLVPRRVSRFVRRARLCVELAFGRARSCGVSVGTRLVLEEP